MAVLTEEEKKELQATAEERRKLHNSEVKKDLAELRQLVEQKKEKEPCEKKR